MSSNSPPRPTTSTKSLRNREVVVDSSKKTAKRPYTKRKFTEQTTESQVELEVHSDSELHSQPKRSRNRRSVSPDINVQYLDLVTTHSQVQTRPTQQEQPQVSSIFNMTAPKQFTAADLEALNIDPAKAAALNTFMQTQISLVTPVFRLMHSPSIPAPQFDSATMSAASYYVQLQNYFSVQGISPDTYHTAVGSVLKGDKKLWFDNVATTITTWKEFKDSFSLRFDSTYMQEKRRKLLYSRHQ